MENDKAGLKFRKIDDDEIVVENNEKIEADYFCKLKTNDERMLYNFEQMERFCHKLGKENHVDNYDNSFYKHYIVMKNFSDETIHVPGKNSEVHYIFQCKEHNLSYLFTVFGNGKHEESKGFVSIDVVNPFIDSTLMRIYKEAVCFISIIDNQGNEKFTQTSIFLTSQISVHMELVESESFSQFINREGVLCNALEILHYDDLVFCVKFEFHKCSDEETEEIIRCLFENDESYKIKIDEKKNHSFEKCLTYDEHLFFDSDLGKILCNNSFFFKSRLNYSRYGTETRKILIPYKDVEPLKNICRILLADYVLKTDYGDICELYKVADLYGIPRAVEFCRRLLKQHVCIDNISLIHKIAVTYNDVELKIAAKSFCSVSGKFICNVFYIGYDGVEEMVDLEHLHNAFGVYVECDNPVKQKREYCTFYYDRIEFERKLIFSSLYNKNENGDLTLSLETDFGKLLCKNSDFFKRLTEPPWSETESSERIIQQEDVEAFNNIYRLLMGGNYIKANTVYDIISLYKIIDFYGIVILAETCRNIFKIYICCRNVKPICKLAEMYYGDIKLKTIVETFEIQSKTHRHIIEQEKLQKRRDFELNKFEISNDEYDFYQ